MEYRRCRRVLGDLARLTYPPLRPAFGAVKRAGIAEGTFVDEQHFAVSETLSSGRAGRVGRAEDNRRRAGSKPTTREPF